MTSNINYLSINENFPVAGQDNDTQVFRDNFGTIKDNFRYTKQDIESLQDITAGLQLTEIENGSDYNNRLLQKAILINSTQKINPRQTVAAEQEIDIENGSYQIYVLDKNCNFTFTNFPTISSSIPDRVGHVKLEIYNGGDGTDHSITFNSVGGTVIKKNGFPAALSGDMVISDISNPVFIEAWAYDSNTVFIKYIGLFEE